MGRGNWEHLTPLFACPAGIRKVIKTGGSFPNREAAFKLLYLALDSLGKKWTKPVLTVTRPRRHGKTAPSAVGSIVANALL